MAKVHHASFEDKIDFENADRGFIAALRPGRISADDGGTAWDIESFAFLKESCPGTVNPKLWRQGQLCAKQGLYQVTDGIYQLRALDLSNMTVVEGERGIIVIDPLISNECARAGLELYHAHRGKRPVTGLIYTHSHADHFGGAAGIIPDNQIPIIAPEGFLESAVSENVFAGNAMTRRAGYMYGMGIPAGPKGLVGIGLGIATSSGKSSLIPPNQSIKETGEEITVDGVRIVFQVTPGTEAPSEMNFYFPQHRALCMAENATHNLHNIITLRGAVVRDAHAWSRYLNEAIVLYANDSDVVFASHHWPTWGTDSVIRFLTEQRDLYGYLHDQTVRMLNLGLTGPEIAEQIILPPALQQAWHTQGYYGSVSHNVKAIYQRYLGWFDGNPAHLWEHPPQEAAKRYVFCMGGVEAILEKAAEFQKKGDLRFAATLLNHAVFAHPERGDSKEALAFVYEQLGYGAENGPWRNFYLVGAKELRSGIAASPVDMASEGVLEGLTTDQVLDFMAIRIDGLKAAEGGPFAIDLHIKDQKHRWRIAVSNGALIHHSVSIDAAPERDPAGLSCTMTRGEMLKLLMGKRDLDGIETKGDPGLLGRLLSLLSSPDPMFAIVTP